MSVHSSLKISGTMSGERNVWTRAERLAALKKVGKWEEGDPVTGIPKVRTRFKVKSKKQVKASAEKTAAGGEAAPAAAAAAPAAAGKPAAAAKAAAPAKKA